MWLKTLKPAFRWRDSIHPYSMDGCMVDSVPFRRAHKCIISKSHQSKRIAKIGGFFYVQLWINYLLYANKLTNILLIFS